MLDLKSLQSDLAFVDLMEQQSTSTSFALEHLIVKKEQIKVKMYQEQKHPRPHVHIDYGSENHAASYAIDNGERLSGNLKSKYDKAVSKWILDNSTALRKVWTDLQNGGLGKDFSQELSAL